MRLLEVDKNEPRGDRNYDELPMKGDISIGGPRFRDPDLLAGQLRTDSPTVTNEATAAVAQLAASKSWRLHQSDVNSAFLHGQRETCKRWTDSCGNSFQCSESCVRFERRPFEWNAERV